MIAGGGLGDGHAGTPRSIGEDVITVTIKRRTLCQLVAAFLMLVAVGSVYVARDGAILRSYGTDATARAHGVRDEHTPATADTPRPHGPHSGTGDGAARDPPFAEMHARIEAMRKDVLAYYGGDEAVLDIAVHKDTQGEAMLAARIARRVLKAREDGAAPFVISAMGSSVTAGHDGFYDTAYPSVLERTLGAIMAQSNLTLTVRNVAVGGRGPWLASLCVRPQVGEDADVITREWEYWPFDAGMQDYGMGEAGKDQQSAALELFLRTAWRLPNQPMVHVLQMQHAKAEDAATGQPYFVAKHIFGKRGKLAAYRDFPVNAFSHFGKPFDHLRRSHPVEERFEKNKKPQKRKCAPSARDDVANCPLDYERQDTFHERARYLGFDEESFPDWVDRFPERLRNLFVNWHPAALGHEVMGNQLAYYYSGILLRGVAMLADAEAAALRAGQPESEWVSELDASLVEAGSAPPLPGSSSCSDLWCEYPSHCAYSYEPRSEGPEVQDWVKPAAAGGRGLRGLAEGGAAPWHTAVAVGQPQPDPDRTEAACAKVLAKEEPTAAEEERCFSGLMADSYKDLKKGITGGRSSGELLLEIDPSKMMKCIVVLEELEYGWAKPAQLANWDHELRVSVNGKECGASCQVFRNVHTQSLVINVREILGGACRRAEVTVGVSVAPLAPSDFSTPPCRASANTCEPAGSWKNYAKGLCSNDCEGVSARRDPERVTTFIGAVILL